MGGADGSAEQGRGDAVHRLCLGPGAAGGSVEIHRLWPATRIRLGQRRRRGRLRQVGGVGGLGFRDQLTESNYALLFTMAVDALVLPWEQAVMQLAFTELGALRFDKDLRGVLTALSDLASWGIRDKFLRLQQISYVLNMDEDETDTNDVFEAGIASGISWQLTPAEVQSVRSLRVNTAPQERSLS